MWRHHPQVARARELLDGGAIGDLRDHPRALRLPGRRPRRHPPAGRARRRRPHGRRLLLRQRLPHAGRRRARARLRPSCVPGGHGVDVALAATLRFPGDVLAHFDCGLAYPRRPLLEAVGTEGSLAPRPTPGTATTRSSSCARADGSVERIDAGPANSYALELADFEAAVRGERQPLLGRDDALGQARTIAALYTSAERNAPCPIA